MSSRWKYTRRAQPKYYRKIKHRSSLEVLWHKFFFRTMVGKVEYEPETYVSPTGELWLPDFRLTFDDPGARQKKAKQYSVLVEIKPFRAGFSSQAGDELGRLQEFYESCKEEIWLLGIPQYVDSSRDHLNAGYTFGLCGGGQNFEKTEVYTDALEFGLSPKEGNYARPRHCVYTGDETMSYDRWAYPLKKDGAYKTEIGQLISYGRNIT